MNTRNRGSALLLAIVVTSSLMVLTLAFLQFSLQANREHRAQLDDTETLYIAEAGLVEAATSLVMNATGNIGSFEAPVRFGGGLFWVEATKLEDEQWLLAVTAMSSSGRVEIEGLVERTMEKGPLPYGFFSERRMKVKKKAFFDSWDPEDGDYASQATNALDEVAYAGTGTLLGSNEGLKLDKNVHVFGDVVVGPNGVVDFKDEDATHVEGQVMQAPTDLHLPPVETPLVEPVQKKLQVSGLVETGFDLEIGPGESRYGDVKIKKNARIKIVGPHTLVVDKKLDIDGEIVIDGTAGPVMIYVMKKAKIKKKSVIRTLSGSSADFYLLVGEPADATKKKKGRKVSIDGTFTGVIYAPDAHVSVKKKAELFGAVLAYSMKHKGPRFHYDESLSKKDSPLDVEAHVRTLTWRVVSIEPRELQIDRGDPFALLGVNKADLLFPADAWEFSDDPPDYGDFDWNDDFPWLDPPAGDEDL